MEKVSKNILGKQSHYIIKIGDKYLINRCTDMEFEGTRGSDLASIYYAPHAIGLTHDLWLNDKVQVKREYPNGGNVIVEGVIVGKYSHMWDMRKPVGQRAFDENKTSNYMEMVNRIKNNKEIQY
jgi:hypothetical protein